MENICALIRDCIRGCGDAKKLAIECAKLRPSHDSSKSPGMADFIKFVNGTEEYFEGTKVFCESFYDEKESDPFGYSKYMPTSRKYRTALRLIFNDDTRLEGLKMLDPTWGDPTLGDPSPIMEGFDVCVGGASRAHPPKIRDSHRRRIGNVMLGSVILLITGMTLAVVIIGESLILA